MKINAIDKKGLVKEYDAILTYHSEEYNKHYVAYTENIYDENNELIIKGQINYQNYMLKLLPYQE